MLKRIKSQHQLKIYLGKSIIQHSTFAHFQPTKSILSKRSNLAKILAISLKRLSCGNDWERFLLIVCSLSVNQCYHYQSKDNRWNKIISKSKTIKNKIFSWTMKCNCNISIWRNECFYSILSSRTRKKRKGGEKSICDDREGFYGYGQKSMTYD